MLTSGHPPESTAKVLTYGHQPGPLNTSTYSSRLYRQFAEELGKRNERHIITTYSKVDSKDVLSTTSTSRARSSTAAAVNFIMLAREEQLETSLEVQPDDLTGKHRDGEQNPLGRPQVLENEDKVVADGTSHADKGGGSVFQTEVGMDLETSQVAARHFESAMFRQQQGTTAKSADREGDYLIEADFGGNPKATTAQQVSTREEAAIGRQQRGTMSTEQNKQGFSWTAKISTGRDGGKIDG